MLQTLIENHDLLLVIGFCVLAFGLFFPDTFGDGNADYHEKLERES